MSLLDRQPTLAVPPLRRSPVHPGPVLLVAAMFLAPLFLDGYWTFSLTTGLLFGMACLGLHVLTSWSRQISLMHAGVVGSALYIGMHVTRRQYEYWTLTYNESGEPTAPRNLPALYGFVAALLVGVVLYLTVGLIAGRLGGVYLVALTFATQFALEQAVFTKNRFTLWGQTAARPEPFGISLESDRRYYWFVALVLAVLLLALVRLRSSRFGRAMAFAGHEPEAAAVFGISAVRYRLAAVAIAGLFAGMSGALSGFLYREVPGSLQYGWFNSVVYLAVVVFAGSASLLAVVVGAVALQLLPQIFLDQQLNVYLLGGLGMLVGLLLGPRGVGGAVADLFAWPRRRNFWWDAVPALYDAVEIPPERP